ncbi:uncharacterized protein LOC123917130 [Trifolium pratense]|uniref:uncharacterized protein LOC123917130 n=1 Tax=Trifolium pratense TaxID=57577 RepID=UPI001E6959F7|nr:uncharacterized protein LOC123917130 [Trifolium pratense]XP_045824723.1 uncharacterized protein LOC123917130 [Trifolium pratense]
MEDKYSLIRKHSGLWKTLRDEDFEEEEIWDVMKERSDYISEVHKPILEKKEISSLPIPIGARKIPRTNSGSSSHETKNFQQSLPVNIPDWSKIYGNNKVNKTIKNVSRYNDYGYYEGDEEVVDDVLNHHGSEDDEEDYDDDDDEFNTRLPPHEIISRRFARSQISSFSVFEGVGRTLKGRDLSKVRNSVLIKTGFLESL